MDIFPPILVKLIPLFVLIELLTLACLIMLPACNDEVGVEMMEVTLLLMIIVEPQLIII
jgi:hypothetical protein